MAGKLLTLCLHRLPQVPLRHSHLMAEQAAAAPPSPAVSLGSSTLHRVLAPLVLAQETPRHSRWRKPHRWIPHNGLNCTEERGGAFGDEQEQQNVGQRRNLRRLPVHMSILGSVVTSIRQRRAVSTSLHSSVDSITHNTASANQEQCAPLCTSAKSWMSSVLILRSGYRTF